MLIAVTGATGFLGGRVVESLANRGHDVLAFGRRPPAAFRKAGLAAYARWDITEGPRPPTGPRAVDAVVHCAGTVTDWGSATEFEAVNVRGTEAVLASFPQNARFVHVSTSSVYDHRRPAGAFPETARYARGPLNHYVRIEIAAEQAVAGRGAPSGILPPPALH